jgi:hypothetical protein
MHRRLTLYIVLFLLPAATMAQTTVDERKESEMANARIMEARKVASVTAQRCLANLSSWRAKDNADDKAKVKAPSFWYEKLSTEELVRHSRDNERFPAPRISGARGWKGSAHNPEHNTKDSQLDSKDPTKSRHAAHAEPL